MGAAITRVVLVLMAFLLLGSCGGGSVDEDLTPTLAPTATPLPTATPEPTPTPTPLPALPSINAPAPVLDPAAAATPSGAAPLGKARNPPSSGGASENGTPAPVPETCADLPPERLSPADILRCSSEALLEARSFRFMTHVQVSPPSTAQPGGTLEVRGAYDRVESNMEYVAVLSVGGQAVERVDFKRIGEMAYGRVEQGGTESSWESAPAERTATAALSDVRLRSAVARTAERGGMIPPGQPDCGEELARLLDPDQSGGEDYHVVEVFPASPDAAECGVYLVETHWVSRDTLRPWRTVIESRGISKDAGWSGQMVFSDYDAELEIAPPPGFRDRRRGRALGE